MHFVAVLNRDGGTFRTMDLEAFAASVERILEAHGHTVECRLVAGKDLIAELERAATSGADVLLAGGGDGTVSAAAGMAFLSGITLAVLPAGTMNLFARELNLPLDLEAALEAIAVSPMRQVDVATANGRPFVHQFSVGLHTRLVRIREQISYSSRYGKMLATVRAFVSAVLRPPRFQIELHTVSGTKYGEASAVSVSNDPLPDGVVLSDPDVLTRGTLGLYVARPMTIAGVVHLFIDALRGRWKYNPLLFVSEVRTVTLTFPRRKSSAQATVDGELIPLEPRITLESHPGALRVIAPPAAPASAAA